MTLPRQLIMIISALFLLMFVGTLIISIGNTRNYLAAQLRSHAQDTATSLGLSLVRPMSENDVAHMETMVNAIFDPGYYREIIIQRADGSTLIERVLPVRVQDVPDWFVRLIPLETPSQESEVMVGWRLAAKVIVNSHPGYAYRQLWLVSVETFWWFLLLLAAAIALLVVVLRLVLRPLGDVERQALAICEREFPIVERLPKTRELRRVVTAMNRMSSKVEQMLSDQSELTEKMRMQANQDPVTGLGNRRYFDARFEHLVRSSDQFLSGALYLIELNELRQLNEQRGFAAGDELLVGCAELLRRTFGDEGRHIIARLGGGSFAVAVADIGINDARKLAQKVARELTQLHAQGLTDGIHVGHVGAAYYCGRHDPAELLAEADMALRAAARGGPNAWHMYDPQTLPPAEVHGAEQWRRIIQDVVDGDRIILHFQPVVLCQDKTPDHYEVLARIPGAQGEAVSTAVFIPMAERHGLIQEIDKAVVRRAMEHLSACADITERCAVNLSPASVHDVGFLEWICAQMQKRPEVAGKIVFESPEYGVLRDAGAARRFIDRVKAVGAAFSLDHFGVGFGSFGYLKSLKVDYIKIDGSYIRGLDANVENQFFVQALTDIAHGLDIRVIAESVETEKEWEAIRALHVDAAQGHFVGRPSAEYHG